MRQPLSAAALRGVAIAPLVLALAGCGALTSESRPRSIIETADTPASSRTIDPSYKIAVEERAPARKSAEQDDEAFIRRAAEIAIQEGHHYGAAAHLSRLAEIHPSDKGVAYNLARHLRYIGALAPAEQALNDARALHPDDALLRLELAKVKIAGGFGREAVQLLEPLRDERPEDPAVLQALGVAYDRLGRHADAQAAYAQAMKQGRPSAALLNNDGLSRMMSGDLAGSIQQLRRASTAPGASPQIRQNLALALSLNGEEEEAQRVSEAALPKALAQETLTYYRSIAGSQDAWSVAKGG